MFLTYRGPANESGCNLPCGFTQTLTQGFIIYFSFVVFTLKRLFSHPSLYALINGINYWLCEWLRNEANIWFNKKRIFFFSSFVAKMFSCRWNVFQACVWGLYSIFPHSFSHLHAFASPIASLSALFGSGDNSKQPGTSSKSWQRLKRERERIDESLRKERKRWSAIWPADSDHDKHLGLLQVWSERDGKFKTGGEGTPVIY